jgi:hypothetical protein
MGNPTGRTFQECRAAIVRTALANYSRVEILAKLQKLGADPPALAVPIMTDRSLAYRLAWHLLPAGQYSADGGQL